MKIWIIGAGKMAMDYAKVLQGLNYDFEVIGRNLESAQKFEKESGLIVKQGGLQNTLVNSSPPDCVIIAVGIKELANVTKILIESGTKRILTEKPGGLNTGEILELKNIAKKNKTDIFVGYNRRFYASTLAARKMIEDDGGAQSCLFEFTEWSHVIELIPMAEGIKENWFLANSTHVADLAFHLCGFPSDWKAFHRGSINWHKNASRFCGAGITKNAVMFSYHADWEAPGRWGVEIMTRKRRFILKPLEELQIIHIGKVVMEKELIDDSLDKKYKPGLYLQVDAFLKDKKKDMCTIEQQYNNCDIYDKIAGYS